jgi:Na+/proline symporter
VYSAISGLWGIVVTDAFQFIFAMLGSIALAWFVLQLPEIGGLAGLAAQVPPGTLSFVPSFSTDAVTVVSLPIASFLTYVTVQWWASWYPGQEPGGGGYVAQRMMSAKDERHSLYATL